MATLTLTPRNPVILRGFSLWNIWRNHFLRFCVNFLRGTSRRKILTPHANGPAKVGRGLGYFSVYFAAKSFLQKTFSGQNPFACITFVFCSQIFGKFLRQFFFACKTFVFCSQNFLAKRFFTPKIFGCNTFVFCSQKFCLDFVYAKKFCSNEK